MYRCINSSNNARPGSVRSPRHHSGLSSTTPSPTYLQHFTRYLCKMASQQRPPAVDDTKHHIVQSLFSKVDEQGTADETLISYLKVYEDEGEGGQKTRYLMLAGKLIDLVGDKADDSDQVWEGSDA
jgi:hypothetical protein